MRKNIMISFLGTSDYDPVKYELNGNFSTQVKFIQNALRQLLNFDSEMILCCTEKSQNNFEKLLEESKTLNLPGTIKQIPISVGKSEYELWEMFKKMWRYFDNEDNFSLIIDITHSFRFIPVMFTIFVQYLKAMKNNIELSGMYYGAFEARNLEQNTAPVFNLTPFLSLFDWSTAITSIQKYGEIGFLADIVRGNIKDVLKESKGQDSNAAALTDMIKPLSELIYNIKACRGPQILNFNKNYIIDNIDKLDKNFLPPFSPLIRRLKMRTEEFYPQGDLKNGFKAVKWCIEHGWTSQAYTLLEEFLITMVVSEIEGDDKICDIYQREKITKILSCLSREIPFEQWDFPEYRQEEIKNTARNIRDKFTDEFIKSFSKLVQMRNDFNHAGFRANTAKYDKLNREIKNIFEAYEKYLFNW